MHISFMSHYNNGFFNKILSVAKVMKQKHFQMHPLNANSALSMAEYVIPHVRAQLEN